MPRTLDPPPPRKATSTSLRIMGFSCECITYHGGSFRKGEIENGGKGRSHGVLGPRLEAEPFFLSGLLMLR